MTITIGILLMIIAAVLLLFAAINFPLNSKVSLGWLGMFFWALSILVGRL